MWLSLRTLKNLVSPQPPQPPHAEVEHVHWDRDSQTWQPHEQPAEDTQPAA